MITTLQIQSLHMTEDSDCNGHLKNLFKILLLKHAACIKFSFIIICSFHFL